MTTAALGLTLTWPGRVLLAECDPMGRRVLPGFMADRLRGPAGPGLLGVIADADPHAPIALEQYVVPIAEDGRVELLHGVRDPRHGVRLGPLSNRLAHALRARNGDVVADLGRVGGTDTPYGLLEAADAVVMVLSGALAQVDAAAPRLELLRGLVPERVPFGLCLVADGAYSAAEVERALGVPVLAEVPYAPEHARVLSDGARPRLTFKTSLLVRSLGGLGRRLRAAVSSSEMVEDVEGDATHSRAATTIGTSR
ncbi:hypothetical protein [Actinomadura litoris]|uniref:CobQ/CobB/MinD/ParA nucleotide binding domain protein n=1 Tax=Actinomadura litoris TaxID=2678616 RepID=A0A7K1KT89_9ACTN|nr:hypothetical protein [Actinomadura litoris]MUN35373.1 hypothetical protein [Actinomadura litoris]